MRSSDRIRQLSDDFILSGYFAFLYLYMNVKSNAKKSPNIALKKQMFGAGGILHFLPFFTRARRGNVIHLFLNKKFTIDYKQPKNKAAYNTPLSYPSSVKITNLKPNLCPNFIKHTYPYISIHINSHLNFNYIYYLITIIITTTIIISYYK